MSRSQRIRFVVATAVGLAAVFVAFVGAPVATMFLWDVPNLSEGDAAKVEAIETWTSISQVVHYVAMGSLVVAGISFVYIFVALSSWFIGQEPTVGNEQTSVVR